MRTILTVAVVSLMIGRALAQKSSAGQPRRATLAQQKMCDEQSRKKFHEENENDKLDGSVDYTSHFDPQAYVCYIMVHRLDSQDVSNVVYDAFEGRVYGSYVWNNVEHKKYWEVAPTECVIKPLGKKEITCKSSEEFETLVGKYFGVGR